MWVLQDGGRWSHLGTEGSLAGYRERKKMWSGALWARRMGKAREPDSIPSPLKSWLQAFRGACHSAVLFLVMIYSNAAVSENIQAAGLFSKNPVCWRTWSAASTYRLELYWMLILRQADQTLAHFTRMTLRDNRTYPWSHRAKSCWRTKEGNTTTLEEGKHFAHCLSETYGFQWPNCPPTHTYLYPMTQFPEDMPSGRYSWKEAAGWNRVKSRRSQNSGVLSPPLPCSRARKQPYIICALMPPSLKAEKYLSCVSASHCTFIWQREEESSHLFLQVQDKKRAPPSGPNYQPKAPPLNTITLEIDFNL